MPEWAELQRNTGQGLLIASYKRLKKDSDRAITPVCVRGGPCPCTLGTARVPSIQAVIPPSCSTLTGAELPQAKKSYIYAHSVTLVVSDSATLWPVACQASLSGEGFSRQEYWSILANTACHTLLELYISCFPSHQLP